MATARLDGMNGDEQLLNGRIYGHDHDDPNPGPLPHRTYAELSADRWTACCWTSTDGGP
ncbi:hypothetical protein ACF090_43190 [Streptomyces sp. NPDC014892]|uniref:hypothetical protein n=1 Tax=Streptomyces sp. NPDC014892 TaxID=3364930 RepID=UPI0036F7BBC4